MGVDPATWRVDAVAAGVVFLSIDDDDDDDGEGGGRRRKRRFLSRRQLFSLSAIRVDPV